MNYNRTAFEADLPAIEPNCDVLSGAGCNLIPSTDDCIGPNGGPPCTAAAFYPFYSIRNVGGECIWQIGNHIPGSTNDFHQNQQYGTLLSLSFLNGGGTSVNVFEDFRQIFSHNACPA